MKVLERPEEQIGDERVSPRNPEAAPAQHLDMSFWRCHLGP